MEVVVIFDNRQLVGSLSFEQESGEATARQLLSTLLLHYLASTRSWLPIPLALLVAASPQAVRVFQPLPKTVAEILDAISVRCSATGDTWSGYLTQAVDSIVELLKRRQGPTPRLLIVILTNDISLSTADPEAGIARFLKAINGLNSIKNLYIRILAPVISTLPSFEIDSPHLQMMRRCLSQQDRVTLHTFPNTGIYYEEELRGLIETLTPTFTSIIPLPKVGHNKLSDLEVELKAYSKSAQDAMHVGLRQPSLYSISPCNRVDPLHIQGKGLIVTPPTTINEAGKAVANSLVFHALSAVLSEQQQMLVLKVPFMERSYQYWALVPPGASDSRVQAARHMVLMLLVDKEDVIRHVLQDSSLVPMTNENTSEAFQEYKEFLMRALTNLGECSDYNPMVCVGGTLQEKVQQSRDTTVAIPERRSAATYPPQLTTQHVAKKQAVATESTKVKPLVLKQLRSSSSTTANPGGVKPSGLKPSNQQNHDSRRPFIDLDDDEFIDDDNIM